MNDRQCIGEPGSTTAVKHHQHHIVQKVRKLEWFNTFTCINLKELIHQTESNSTYCTRRYLYVFYVNPKNVVKTRIIPDIYLIFFLLQPFVHLLLLFVTVSCLYKVMYLLYNCLNKVGKKNVLKGSGKTTQWQNQAPRNSADH